MVRWHIPRMTGSTTPDRFLPARFLALLAGAAMAASAASAQDLAVGGMDTVELTSPAARSPAAPI